MPFCTLISFLPSSRRFYFSRASIRKQSIEERVDDKVGRDRQRGDIRTSVVVSAPLTFGSQTSPSHRPLNTTVMGLPLPQAARASRRAGPQLVNRSK
ncbi:hypothetical protein JM93_04053 [Roseibium hamelinense]|uniref:Uncharacterized protein n=1 Tax=Roseibium hamelinense TaxID=150831 RepID=A0A562SI32_9HYPH|nr:hypothetical protein JM93_04053 [Roseibium hamelinense]